MTARTAVRRNGLKAAQVLDLPAMTTLPEACAALGISNDLGYDLTARGEFPVPVVKINDRVLRVRRADLLAFLGLVDTTLRPTEDDTNHPENADAAGANPAASSEHVTTPTSE